VGGGGAKGGECMEIEKAAKGGVESHEKRKWCRAQVPNTPNQRRCEVNEGRGEGVGVDHNPIYTLPQYDDDDSPRKRPFEVQ